MPLKIDNLELTDQQVQEFREVFDAVDKDGGGTLSVSEVRDLMHMLGLKMSLEEVQSMVNDIDSDKSGEVDFEEFLKVVAHPRELPFSAEDLRRSFKVFAAENPDAPNGCIEPGTLGAALEKYCGDQATKKELAALMAAIQCNHEGYVDYEDLIKSFMPKQ